MYWIVNLNSRIEQSLTEIVKRTISKRKELEKENKELDKFIYRTSHDLRSPLSSVKGLATIATHETTDANAKRFLKEIVANIERLDSFTKEIIEYSKNALTDVMLETVNFNVLVSEIIDRLKYMKEASSIQFLLNIDVKQDFLVDRRRIRIVLDNFIVNAIKYHDPKKSFQYIQVNVNKVDDELIITVADNGIGIPPEYKSKIFDMFYRATSVSIGSGLGLYIVKEAVEKMGGIIEVESNPGSGSKFSVHIPVGLSRFKRKQEMLHLQN
ncbi:MAG: HAMP domain-containing sensor histidine kinase [Cyclobacteriaceae bacterium]